MTPNVLITGASKGIGRACTFYLHAKGWRVFAGVRKQQDADSLTKESGGKVLPVFIDVTEAEMIANAAGTIAAEIGVTGLQGLVNNAGIALYGPLEFLPLDDYRKQFEINVLGQIAVTQAFLPLIRKGQGRIVNISSMSGRFASPFLSPYSSSKFALEAISDALRRELASWDIHVAVIEPGSIATPIWEKTQSQSKALKETLPVRAWELYGAFLQKADRISAQNAARSLPPRRVAQAVDHALSAHRPRSRYPIGLDSWGVSLAARLLPDRLLDWFTKIRLGT